MLATAQERSVEPALRQIVAGIAASPSTALVRIWLTAPGDLCAVCHFARECPNHARCLHLAASAGRSQVSGREYTRLDGRFRRIPFGVFKVGRVAASAEPFLIPEVTPEPAWAQDRAWIAAEGIQSFAGQPLIFRGEVLGVLGVFERAKFTGEDFKWLRTFADHAAIAIANARAFEEIEQLKRRLEKENDYLQEEVKAALNFGPIVGRSSALQKVIHQIDLVARTEASVLILGESGTGQGTHRPRHPRTQRAARPSLDQGELRRHSRGAV